MLSEVHQFRLPETILFGWGAVERVGEQARRLGRRALLVSGRTATKSSGIQPRILNLLRAAELEITVFDGVNPEPAASTVEAAAERMREAACDVVVGVGGGSPLDVAKAAAGMAGLKGGFLEYLRGRPIDRAGLPFIGVPTTAGTAAEITKNAVFLDEERRVKIGIRSDFWFPKVALIDPELTMSMPPALTAASGMDALSHAVESYVSRHAHHASEALSAKAIGLIAGALQRAFADGSNRQAREDMALASVIAGMAFANVGVGAAHALGHVIGPAFGLSHGQACGLLLPYVLAFNLPACQEKGKEIAHLLTGQPANQTSPQAAIEALFQLLAALGLPSSLAQLGARETDLPPLVPGAMLSGALRTNPRELERADLLAILQNAWKGRG